MQEQVMTRDEYAMKTARSYFENRNYEVFNVMDLIDDSGTDKVVVQFFEVY